MEVCDVVAFVSEADSMISPSEGVDGDLDRCDVMAAPHQSRRSTEVGCLGFERDRSTGRQKLAYSLRVFQLADELLFNRDAGLG
jgi:hypothetical protein